MTSNSYGPTAQGSMDTFDKLPKHIRQKLANSAFNWSPEETQDMIWLEGAAETSAFLADADREMARRHYAILASGIPYPKETAREVQVQD